MTKMQRTFTREFKLEAVKLAQSSHKPFTQIAHDLGIAETTCSGGDTSSVSRGSKPFQAVGISFHTKRSCAAYSARMSCCDRSATSSKKRWASSRAAKGCRFPFMAEHCQEYPITVLCKTLEVSESGYYAWKSREPSQHCREDARLSADIQHIFVEHRQVYGSPRMRVVRLMQQLGVSAQTKKRRKPTTQSSLGGRFAPNQLNREFAASVPNQKWVTDTTAIATAEGWLYLAVILDLFSRRVGGWAMAATEDGHLVELALRMAFATRQPRAVVCTIAIVAVSAIRRSCTKRASM